MFKVFLATISIAVCISLSCAGTTYSEISIVTVLNNEKGKPSVSTGSQVYRIEGDSLFIQRSDGSEYFYNIMVVTIDKLRYTCGNKYLVFEDESKNQLIVSHIDEIETKITYLRKKKK